jgi:hypothetical protein
LFSSLFLVLCYICKLAATTCQGLPGATLSLGRRATVLSGACLDAIQIPNFFTLSPSHQFLTVCMKY